MPWQGEVQRCVAQGALEMPWLWLPGSGGLREGTGGSWPCYAVCSPHRGTAGWGLARGCRRGFQHSWGGLGAIRDKGTLARTRSWGQI